MPKTHSTAYQQLKHDRTLLVNAAQTQGLVIGELGSGPVVNCGCVGAHQAMAGANSIADRNAFNCREYAIQLWKLRLGLYQGLGPLRSYPCISGAPLELVPRKTRQVHV
jgi:hypothetical protein